MWKLSHFLYHGAVRYNPDLRNNRSGGTNFFRKETQIKKETPVKKELRCRWETLPHIKMHPCAVSAHQRISVNRGNSLTVKDSRAAGNSVYKESSHKPLCFSRMCICHYMESNHLHFPWIYRFPEEGSSYRFSTNTSVSTTNNPRAREAEV